MKVSEFMPSPDDEVAFVVEREGVLKLRLEDGTRITIKTVVMGINDCGVLGDGVTPNYNVRQQLVLDVQWSPEVRAKIEAAVRAKE